MNDHYSFTAEFAGLTVSLDVCRLQTKLYCKDHIKESAIPQPAVSVRTTEEDIVNEWKRMLKDPRFQPEFVNTLPDYYFEIFALHRKMSDAMLPFGVLVYHGSCVVMDGRGFILSADSGVGKSTFAKKWAAEYPQKAFILNDDKPFIVKTASGYKVFGSPWNGKHHLGRNSSAPLESIFFLERGDRNRLCRIGEKEALRKMCMQVFRPEKEADFEASMELLRDISRGIPCFQYVFDIDTCPVRDLMAYYDEEKSSSWI